MKTKITKNFDLFFFITTVILILIFAAFAKAQSSEISAPESAASGGAFTLEKSVIAGGAAKLGAPLGEHGTLGQSIAGIKSSGGQFSISGGFWTPENFAPTASGVAARRRVKTNAGKGIRNVIVTVTFPKGETRATVSGASGFCQFAGIPAGATYIFSVLAKRYVFSQPTQIGNIIEDTQDIDFVADTPSLTSLAQ